MIFDGTNKSGLTWLRVSKNPDRELHEHGPSNLTGHTVANVADEFFLHSHNLHIVFASLPHRRQGYARLPLEQLLQRF